MKKINLNEIKKVLTRDELKKVNAGYGGSCHCFIAACGPSNGYRACCVCNRCC